MPKKKKRHTRYDPEVIRTMVDRLYTKADSTVALLTIFFCIAGALAGFAILQLVGAIVGLILGGLIGYALGEWMALKIRVEAQTLLCQMHIEENTRRLAEATAPKPQPNIDPLAAPQGRYQIE